jgi:rfaE bifunctional protein nucleotidyltransferase chain/domain
MHRQSAEILSREELVERLEAKKAGGCTVALANGCFDLFHVGHTRYLVGASRLADILVVGINSDEQVRALKGEGRPYIPESERAEIVAALGCVDYVTVFPERTVTELIRAIRPDFHAKGTDYTEESVPEKDVVAECGGRVAIVGDPKDHSSTELIGRVGRSR